MVMNNDDGTLGLTRLNDGLRVRDIATFGLARCRVGDDPKEVLGREDLRQFDQIPVYDGERLVAILERASGERRPIDESVLVSADDPLSHFIYTARLIVW